jgi:hypothetical protein
MLLLLALACGGAPAAGDTAGATAGTVTLQPGDYAFTTRAADDACLGGALELLFMPEGPDTPHAFTYPIPLPAAGDLPASYDVDFREPFVGMPVTVTATDGGGLAVRGSVMEAVALGAAYGDCVATMTVDVDLLPTSETSLVGEGRIDISDPRGADERCPLFDADPCRVTLDIAATRISTARARAVSDGR